MFKRLAVLNEFISVFVHYLLHVRELMALLLLLLGIGGFAISRLEDLELGDGIYFAFITGLSIGYGDIVPHTTMGRIVSVAIGFIGILVVGFIAAIATRALADCAKRYRETTSQTPTTS